MRKTISDYYARISVTYDGVDFYSYYPRAFNRLLSKHRQSGAKFAIYGDIGGVLESGDIYVRERVMLVCSKDYPIPEPDIQTI